jgi:hypothetical protein
MTVKTAAQVQLEFLKKLKEQAGSSSRPRTGSVEAGQGPGTSMAASNPKGRKSRRPPSHSIPLSAKAWESFKQEGLQSGKFKVNQALGDYLVRLLLKLPEELQGMPPEAQEELFEKVRDWVKSHGLT